MSMSSVGANDLIIGNHSSGHGLGQAQSDSQTSPGTTVVQTYGKSSSGAQLNTKKIYDFPVENRQKRLEHGRALVGSNPNRDNDDPSQWSEEEKIKVYIGIMARPRLDPMITNPLRSVMKGYQKHLGEVADFKDKIYNMSIDINAVIQKAQCQLDRLSSPSTNTGDIPEICTKVLSIMSTEAAPKLMEIATLIPKESLDVTTNTPVVQYCVKFHEMMEHDIRTLVATTGIAYLLKELTYPTMEIVASILGLNMVLSPRRVNVPVPGRYDRVPQKMVTYRPMESLNDLDAKISDIQPGPHSENVEPKQIKEFYAIHDKHDLLSFIDDFLVTFKASMMNLSFPNSNLRRVYDVLKYKVRESNQVIAELEARGLYKRPTGDSGDGDDTEQVQILQNI